MTLCIKQSLEPACPLAKSPIIPGLDMRNCTYISY